MHIYCTYLTTYRGNKLPNFYIGSSKVERIQSGYRGSVSSKQFRKIWIKELKENPHLFSTKIVSYHLTNEEAKAKELFFHRALDVVKSVMYMNTSEARKNGFFGKDVSGDKNPMYGKRGADNPNFGKKRSQETIKLMTERNSRPMSIQQRKKLSQINLGKSHSIESNEKNRATHLAQLKAGTHNSQVVYKCEHCCFVGRGSGFIRYHSLNCKLNPDKPDNVIGNYSEWPKEDKRKLSYKCIHCGTIGSGVNMKRYHFDNCRLFSKERV